MGFLTVLAALWSLTAWMPYSLSVLAVAAITISLVWTLVMLVKAIWDVLPFA